MKILLYIAILCGLVSCKAKKVVTESITSEITDTTKIAIDSAHTETTKQESLSSVVIHTDLGYIEFVGSGGTLSIDGDKISADGVLSYHHDKHTTQAEDKTAITSTDSVATHQWQANGIRSQESKQFKQEPQKQSTKALKWYQRITYYVGALCCVAAIIYAIFLYLRKKT